MTKEWKLISWATFSLVDVAKMVKEKIEKDNKEIGQKIELEIRDMNQDGMKFGIYRKIK